jgi:hypothetical protein
MTPEEWLKANGEDLTKNSRAAKKQNYNDFLAEAAQFHGIEDELPVLQQILRVESGGNPNAKSPKGATGLMQLMPDTARAVGVKNINDPRENIFGGVKYYRDMLEQFGGDRTLALAAYNAGPGAVKKYKGVPPYKETQNYVTKIMGSIGNDIQPRTDAMFAGPGAIAAPQDMSPEKWLEMNSVLPSASEPTTKSPEEWLAANKVPEEKESGLKAQAKAGILEGASSVISSYASMVDPLSAMTGAGIMPSAEEFESFPSEESRKKLAAKAKAALSEGMGLEQYAAPAGFPDEKFGPLTAHKFLQPLAEHAIRGGAAIIPSLPEYLASGAIIGNPVRKFATNYLTGTSGPLLSLIGKSPTATKLVSNVLGEAATFGAVGALAPEDTGEAISHGAQMGGAMGSLSLLPRSVKVPLAGAVGTTMAHLQQPEAPLEAKLGSGVLLGTLSAFGKDPKAAKRQAEIAAIRALEAEAAKIKSGQAVQTAAADAMNRNNMVPLTEAQAQLFEAQVKGGRTTELDKATVAIQDRLAKEAGAGEVSAIPRGETTFSEPSVAAEAGVEPKYAAALARVSSEYPELAKDLGLAPNVTGQTLTGQAVGGFEIPSEMLTPSIKTVSELRPSERLAYDIDLREVKAAQAASPKPKGLFLFSGIPINPERVKVRFQELLRAGQKTAAEILGDLQNEWQASPSEIVGALKGSYGMAAKITIPRSEQVDPTKVTELRDFLLAAPDISAPHTGTIARKIFGGRGRLNEKHFEFSWKNPLSFITESQAAKQLKDFLYWPVSQSDKERHILDKQVDSAIKNARKDFHDVDHQRVFAYMQGRSPEGRDAVKAMKMEIPSKESMTARAMELVDWFDTTFEATLPELNKTLAAIGKPATKGVTGYLPLLRRLDELRHMGYDPVSLDAEYFHPNSPQFNSLKKRVKIPEEYQAPVFTDPFDLTQHYMHFANRFIKMAPHVKAVRDLVGKPDESLSLWQGRPNLAKYLDMWADGMAGIKTTIRTPFDSTIENLTRNWVSAELGFRVLSVLNQSGAMVFTIAKSDPINAAKAFLQVFDPVLRAANKEESVKLVSRRYDIMLDELAESVMNRRLKNWQRTGFALLEAADNFTAQWGYQALKNRAMKLGLSEADAIKFADEYLVKTHGGSSLIDRSPIQRSALGKLLTAFQTFTINEFNFLARDVFGIKNPGMTAKDVAKTTINLFIGGMLYNALLGAGGIRTPIADPIRALKRTEERGGGPGTFATEMVKELAGHVPIYSSFAYGRAPFGAVASGVWDAASNRSLAKTGEVLLKLRGVPGVGQLSQMMRTQEGHDLRWQMAEPLPWPLAKEITPTEEAARKAPTLTERLRGKELEKEYSPVLIDQLLGY